MRLDSKTQAAIQAELEKAEAARRSGNEGQARVCARRAAGLAIKSLFLFLGEEIGDPSAYAMLKRIETHQNVPVEARSMAESLLVRVNPDYTLPAEIDLIANARQLIEWVSEQIQGDKF